MVIEQGCRGGRSQLFTQRQDEKQTGEHIACEAGVRVEVVRDDMPILDVGPDER